MKRTMSTRGETIAGTACGAGRLADLSYAFRNVFPVPIEVWLALPLDLPWQRIRQLDLSPQPIQVSPPGMDSSDPNRIAYFKLEPGQGISMQVRAELLKPGGYSYEPAQELNDLQRARFTRSSTLIQVTDSIRAEAVRIVGKAQNNAEKARRLYHHIIRQFRYRWPPAERGSQWIRRNGYGDCAEYSFLYAAWCRALGIPCRVMVGTFAHGDMRAHVWNEVYLDMDGAGLGSSGEAWLPVDTSVHQPTVRVPLLADLDWWLQGVERKFGRVGGDRLAFSVDPEVVLTPSFSPQTIPEELEVSKSRFGDSFIAWGLESLKGTAPYLQPLYLRVPATAEAAAVLQKPDGVLSRLMPTPQAASVTRVLGHWQFKDPLAYRLFTVLMVIGFLVGASDTFLNRENLLVWDVMGSAGYITAHGIYIARTGLKWWKLGLLILLLFGLLVAVLRLLEPVMTNGG